MSDASLQSRSDWQRSRAACASLLWLAGTLGGCDEAGEGAVYSGSPATPSRAEADARPDPGSIDDGAPYATRLRRLTHREYENTVEDLLHVTGQSADFLDDPHFAGFDNNADALRVTGRLGRDYRRSAEALAAKVTLDRGLLEELVPCEETTSACVDQFIRHVGLLAFRRPLEGGEVDRYAVLFAEGAKLFASGDDFADGVRLVLEALLQSPYFLYRVELGTEEDEEGFVPLNSYELATRLSYMLTASMPDAELLQAAADDRLIEAEVLEQEAERLVRTEAVSRRVRDFHEQWLDLGSFDNLSKDSSLFPEFSSDLGQLYRAETLGFVQYTLLDQGQGLKSLLTAPTTFVNELTAPFYGLAADDFGSELERVSLDPAERRGLFTQLGFLAARAYTTDTSPIFRGVFLLRRVLCEDIPDPPAGIDVTLPSPDGEIVTTRDQVEAHTAAATCASCHSLINPIGFAFEGYDAVGRLRTTDNGQAVDTQGMVELSSGTLAFDGALDLVEQLAESEAVRACYASKWLTYAYGRAPALSDASTLAELTRSLQDDTYSVRQLLVDLTRPRAFTHRAPTEID